VRGLCRTKKRKKMEDGSSKTSRTGMGQDEGGDAGTSAPRHKQESATGAVTEAVDLVSNKRPKWGPRGLKRRLKARSRGENRPRIPRHDRELGVAFAKKNQANASLYEGKGSPRALDNANVTVQGENNLG